MAPSIESLLDRTLQQLLQTERDSTPSSVPRTYGPPSQFHLECLKAANSPEVFAASTRHFKAHERWNSNYFREVMGSQLVTVAMTPNGLADSIVAGKFVQPYEAQTTVNEMLDWCHATADRPRPPFPPPPTSHKDPDPTCRLEDAVRYAQLQNGSLNLEFQKLREDVDPDSLSWASSTFGPDCLTNIWLGTHLSVTTIHHDPYENIYCQILGRKKITLWRPSEYVQLSEHRYPAARYHNINGSLEIVKDSPPRSVPWLSTPTQKVEGLAGSIMEVTLNPGDALYLPALWFHQVEQLSDDEGLCVSVNYWWDLDYTSALWREWKFMRKIKMIQSGRLEECEEELDAEEDL